MWGSATFATEVSTISMIVGSITVMVMSHLLTVFVSGSTSPAF